MSIRNIFLICSCLFVFSQSTLSQTSDNGDGTFTNPVIWTDLPDPDVIRVGDTFYMVSTSMHYFPGVTLMDSKDLVNWNITSNIVTSFDEHEAYDLKNGNRYAFGQWATSVRYLNNKFHVLFNSNAEGTYLYTAINPRGKWTKHKINNARLYDPGMFIEDGRLFVAHGNSEIYITELDTVTYQAKTESKLIYKSHRRGLEGNRLYYINGYYYLYCTYGGSTVGQTCLRSKSLFGPYEERLVMFDSGNLAESYLHQSCMVDLQDGTYWGMIFQDRVGLGRIPYLVPVYWIDEWPLLGNPMDGIMRLKKPVQSDQIIPFPTSDEFSEQKLQLQWQGNHNLDFESISLTKKTGHLRLYTSSITDSLLKARNTICQRIVGPYSEATTRIIFNKMKNGDRAGLVVLQSPYAMLMLEKLNGDTYLSMTLNESKQETVKLKGSVVYLRATVNGISDKVTFSYSLDNKKFTPLGTNLKMAFNLSIFCGNRYGLFNYATKNKGGFIDIDWFRVTHKPLFERSCTNGKVFQAEWFDHNTRCETSKSGINTDEGNLDVEFTNEASMISFVNLETKEKDMKTLKFKLRTINAKQAMLEVIINETGEVIGHVDLKKNTDGYEYCLVKLNKSMQNCKRLDIRVWKHYKEGVILMDSFEFCK